MTSTAKTFERGAAVEVQREVNGPWLRAKYDCPSVFCGWHYVRVLRMRRSARVPSRRIRKRSVK